MEPTPADIRDLLTAADRLHSFVEGVIEMNVEGVSAEPGSTTDEVAVFRHLLETHYHRAVNIIFQHAGSEIEKVFLGSLVISFLVHDPAGLVVTGPTRDAPKDVQSRQAEFEALRQVREQASAAGKGPRAVQEYTAWLEATGRIDHEEAAHWRMLDVIHPLIENSFHLTPQAGFPDIMVGGRSIRADALVWVPKQRDVRLVIECDGYEWHSNRKSFIADRQRDRALQMHGYQVVRFSGHEIYHDPVGSAGELFGRLQDLASTWVSDDTKEPM